MRRAARSVMADLDVPAPVKRRWAGRYPPPDDQDGWQVTVFPEGERVIRRSVDPPDSVLDEDWHHDSYIWPGWAPRMNDKPVDAQSPLMDVHAYWESASSRIRDAAKLMATVLGTTLGFLVGTSPLAQDSRHHLDLLTGAIGGVGLLLLVVTLIVILRVLVPDSVSFVNVLDAPQAGPLHRWKETVHADPDLYLPCGINSLNGLRQAIKVEELTLMALAAATHQDGVTDGDVALLQEAEVARAARLRELRKAATDVALVGEYYKLQAKSGFATRIGPLCAGLGIMFIVGSVALSLT